VVINAPYVPYVLAWLGPSFLSDKFVTGFWAWELPRLPRSWERSFAAVHAIAMPSLFTASAVAASNVDLPVQIRPHPVARLLRQPVNRRGIFTPRIASSADVTEAERIGRHLIALPLAPRQGLGAGRSTHHTQRRPQPRAPGGVPRLDAGTRLPAGSSDARHRHRQGRI
jgi:hypothetical protein